MLRTTLLQRLTGVTYPIAMLLACSADVERLPPGDQPDTGVAILDAGTNDAGVVCDVAELLCGDRCCSYGQLCERGSCRADVRGPYCTSCQPKTVANPLPCGDPQNLCLVSTTASFCGVDCSLDQACPYGYTCKAIAISTGAGMCTSDAECPRDNCDASTGRCAFTGQPCQPGGTPCGALPCVDGGCLIGRNCIPSEGLTCDDVGP